MFFCFRGTRVLKGINAAHRFSCLHIVDFNLELPFKKKKQFYFFKITYFFMAVLGLHAVCGLSLVEAKHAGSMAPAPGLSARAQQLRCTGLLALSGSNVGSSQTRSGTCVPCTGRRILMHCMTWEDPGIAPFFRTFYLME